MAKSDVRVSQAFSCEFNRTTRGSVLCGKVACARACACPCGSLRAQISPRAPFGAAPGQLAGTTPRIPGQGRGAAAALALAPPPARPPENTPSHPELLAPARPSGNEEMKAGSPTGIASPPMRNGAQHRRSSISSLIPISSPISNSRSANRAAMRRARGAGPIASPPSSPDACPRGLTSVVVGRPRWVKVCPYYHLMDYWTGLEERFLRWFLLALASAG